MSRQLPPKRQNYKPQRPSKPLQRPAPPSQRPNTPKVPINLAYYDPGILASAAKATLGGHLSQLAASANTAAIAVKAIKDALDKVFGDAYLKSIANMYQVPPELVYGHRIIDRDPNQTYRFGFTGFFNFPMNTTPPTPTPYIRELIREAEKCLPGTRMLNIRYGYSRPAHFIQLFPYSRFLITVNDKIVAAVFACDEKEGWADCYEVDANNQPLIRSGADEVRTFRLKGVVRIHRVVENPPSFDSLIETALNLIKEQNVPPEPSRRSNRRFNP